MLETQEELNIANLAVRFCKRNNIDFIKQTRDWLKSTILSFSTDKIYRFKKRYGNTNSPIYEIVDSIPDEDLDWAMYLTENTINNKEGAG